MASAAFRRAILRARAVLPKDGGAAATTSVVPALARWFSSEAAPRRRFAALWGNGDYGRLGLGSLESRWKPTICPFFHADPPASIACGGAHTLFLTERGRVYATGLNDYGQLGISSGESHMLEPIEVCNIPDKVVQISAGYHHSAAITEDGGLFVWGNNSSGQLGLGKSAKSILHTPTRVDSLADRKAKMVALGAEHSIAITDEGNALSWGSSGSGRLGHGKNSSILGLLLNSSEYTPRLIKKFEGVKVKRVAAGMLHSAFIDEQGSVFIFGAKTTDNLDFGEKKNVQMPSAVEELPFSQEVACGGYHTCVVTNRGDLYTWGSNENGCLGLGSTYMIQAPESVRSSFFKSPIVKEKVVAAISHLGPPKGVRN